MSKAALIKRLSWYYPAERFSAVVLCGGIVYVLVKYPVLDALWLLYGLLLVDSILFQGQHYWKLKLYRLTGQHVDQARSLAFFGQAKRLNIWLICFIPVVLLLQLYLMTWTPKPGNTLFIALLANTLGVLEHINYYHIQLMVDNTADFNYIRINGRLKIASLAKDLKERQM